ncbi:hypothetical protein DdX_15798 [Ditylenchus destructor]|uniref:Uncharacterized protein n=1 Tax=Ditylenchus destructor TaxID=166010 RepID=A0AAD4R0P1_9BILA|nr:hypothetical protein DdX_15798 [Ditylenchus destructor]
MGNATAEDRGGRGEPAPRKDNDCRRLDMGAMPVRQSAAVAAPFTVSHPSHESRLRNIREIAVLAAPRQQLSSQEYNPRVLSTRGTSQSISSPIPGCCYVWGGPGAPEWS